MAVREIVNYGDPRLVARNEPIVNFEDPMLPGLIRDLLDTCWAAPGCGLAAPQIGINKRIAVVDLSVGKDPSAILVLVNPVVADAKGLIRDEEGCLSFPDIVEVVERPEKVTLEAFNEKGEKTILDGDDLLARAFCHEVDHLDARLFIEHLSSLKRGFVLRKVLKRKKVGAW
jgi:peptide deformylase